MITPQEVKTLLSELESDRIERTISTSNTNKFGQAICAFANDLPQHNRPRYLIIGADDKTDVGTPIPFLKKRNNQKSEKRKSEERPCVEYRYV